MVRLLIQTRRRVSVNHRGRLDIIADILGASCGGVKKTYLMYRCNLSFRQLKYYLNFLLRNGLLRAAVQNGDRDPGLFEVTDKGKEFMKAYSRLTALMK